MLLNTYDEQIIRRRSLFAGKNWMLLKTNHLAAMAKAIDRCNNVSKMAGCFNDKKIADNAGGKIRMAGRKRPCPPSVEKELIAVIAGR